MRKGMSVLVSSVIMVVIVLAVAGIVANWSEIFARERAGGVVGQADRLIECSNSDLFINSVEIDCQNLCDVTGGDKTISLSVRNTGDVSLTLERFYMTNKVGTLFEIILPETKLISSGSVQLAFVATDFDCSAIVDNIEVFEVLSSNCPKEGRDSLSGDNIVFINCEL
ncbi:hypothetical protein CL614_01485 [archaeon]|nr:hypothetical protein [archaeon]|tara:strand:- start:3574 stop:4077 length:504 start_codon:yes stop_codon:yes gene_type:complete